MQGGERQVLCQALCIISVLLETEALARWGCILYSEVQEMSQAACSKAQCNSWQSANILFCSYKYLSDSVSDLSNRTRGFANPHQGVRCLGGLDCPRRQPQPFISSFSAAVGLLSPSTSPEIFIKVSLVTFSPV